MNSTGEARARCGQSPNLIYAGLPPHVSSKAPATLKHLAPMRARVRTEGQHVTQAMYDLAGRFLLPKRS